MADVEARLRAALTYRAEHVTPDTLQRPQLPAPRRWRPRVPPALAAAACVLAIVTAGVVTYAHTGHHRTRVGVPPAPGFSAIEMCNGGLTHKTITSATTVTVGEVRALSGGPSGAAVLATAFPGADRSAPAAWCWVSSGGHSWTAYAVTPGHRAIQVASYTGLTSAPTGTPLIK